MKRFLIVVDMQKDFVDGALGTKEAVAITDRTAARIRDFDGEIFVTLDTHFDNYPETAEGRKLPIPHCIRGTAGWQTDAKIRQALEGKKYTPVEKHTFGSKELPQMITQAANGEHLTIELIGLCTDICVISNALLLKAHFPESEITVDAACCAGVTPETHIAALTIMKCCQINVINN